MKGKRDKGMFEEITTEEKAIELQNRLGKRILQHSKFEEDNVRIVAGVAFVMPKNCTNSYTDIVIRGDVYGRVLRTHKDVKPIFVSIGNFIDLETATIIIGKLITKESHVPLPIRLADLETHKWRKIYKQDNLKILTNLVY